MGQIITKSRFVQKNKGGFKLRFCVVLFGYQYFMTLDCYGLDFHSVLLLTKRAVNRFCSPNKHRDEGVWAQEGTDMWE